MSHKMEGKLRILFISIDWRIQNFISNHLIDFCFTFLTSVIRFFCCCNNTNLDCKHRHHCGEFGEMVCGSDGLVYESECELEVTSCQFPEMNLMVADENTCQVNSGTWSDYINDFQTNIKLFIWSFLFYSSHPRWRKKPKWRECLCKKSNNWNLRTCLWRCLGHQGSEYSNSLTFYSLNI